MKPIKSRKHSILSADQKMPSCDTVNVEIGITMAVQSIVMFTVLSREQIAFAHSFIKVMWDAVFNFSYILSTWLYFIPSTYSIFESCIRFHGPRYVPAAVDDGLQLFGLERSRCEDALGDFS